MPAVPASCNTCGAIFPSSFELSGGAKLHISGFTCGPCPRCGGLGSILDGLYYGIGDAVRLLNQPGATPEKLRHLAEILTKSQQQHLDPQAVAKKIEIEAPELAGFATWVHQYLVPKNGGEVYGMISVLLAAIAIAISLWPNNASQKTMSEHEVSAIVEKAVAAAIQQTQNSQRPVTVREDVTPKKKKIGRNDSCPCKSGKKHKMCCLNKTNATTR